MNAADMVGLIQKLIAKSPPGYEIDYARAEIIKQRIDAGESALAAIEPPENWRDIFIGISFGTDLPASMAAQFAGVSLSYIRLYLKRVVDHPIVEALNFGRLGNFERRIDNPTPADLRSPSIPVTGINALSDWQTDTKETQDASEAEIDKLIEMRKRYGLALDEKLETETIESERQRSEASVLLKDNGPVLGLNFNPDFEDDE